MKDNSDNGWAKRCDDFMRRHPAIYFVVVLVLAFLSGPLMMAASQAAAVLYKDF